MTLYGTEISFRLGPGSVEEARDIAARLAAAAAGCRRHVLFVDADAGEYGCLAEWDRREEAEAFAAGEAAREQIALLGERQGRAARVRLYAMEEERPSPT
jgi:quinol monooxygenase YgiN